MRVDLPDACDDALQVAIYSLAELAEDLDAIDQSDAAIFVKAKEREVVEAQINANWVLMQCVAEHLGLRYGSEFFIDRTTNPPSIHNTDVET